MEAWRDIPGLTGIYQASDQGRVRSLDRWGIDTIGRQTYRRGRILKQTTRSGHPGILTSVDGDSRSASTCRLVALAFLGRPPPIKAPRVVHIDGDVSNNNVGNLRWSNHSEIRVIALRQQKSRLIANN